MNLYRCRDCECQFERNKLIKRCPECKSKDIFEAAMWKDPNTGKYYQYKEGNCPYISIKLGDSELKSLDHLGRRNYERDDKVGIIQEKAEKNEELDQTKPLPNGLKRIKKKKVKPWWRDGKVDTSLGSLNDTQKVDYVLKGTK